MNISEGMKKILVHQGWTPPGEGVKTKAAEIEPWPKRNDDYYFIDDEANVEVDDWEDHPIDIARKKAGNCFRTKAEAKKSLLYFALNSDYHYWLPGMDKPEETPAGAQWLCKGDWVRSVATAIWETQFYRWPKDQG